MLGFSSARFFVIAAAIVGVLGCGGEDSPDGADEGATPEVPRAACASPAPIDRAKAGGLDGTWIVALHASTGFDSEVDGIAARHGLAVVQRLWIANAFVVQTEETTLAALRCEPEVRSITQDRRLRAIAP